MNTPGKNQPQTPPDRRDRGPDQGDRPDEREGVRNPGQGDRDDDRGRRAPEEPERMRNPGRGDATGNEPIEGERQREV